MISPPKKVIWIQNNMKIGTRERGTSHIRHIKKNLAVRFAKTLSSCQVLSYYLHYIKTKGIGVFLVAGRQKILTIMPLDAKDLSHSPVREALRVTARAIKVSSLSRTVLPLSQPCSPTRRHRQPDGREGRQHRQRRIPQGCLSSVWPPR